MPNSNFKNDWTLMFFFASDNTLAPLLVSELKAIKDAGFQEHTEVLVYFDPLEKGCPTKIYNVNSKRKAYALEQWKKDPNYPKSLIGDGNDSYVRKMDDDEVKPWNFSTEMQTAMAYSSRTPADKMLEHFIDYGMNNHKARNYMLFLIGHGMIVGRDIFLPDEDPISAITMKRLKEIMQKFGRRGETQLRLLNLHSCSMSSLEVAYQLRGTANYLMAHQGPAFVNSWPYRQLLKKILNTIEKEKHLAVTRAHKTLEQKEVAIKNKQINVEKLVEKLYYHLLYNATDFLSAGYSADLALCSLEENKLLGVQKPLQDLVKKLKEHLEAGSLIKDLILLAHWDSQSFWEENYTDLYDFCLCLGRRCQELESTLATGKANKRRPDKTRKGRADETHKDNLVHELGEVRNYCQGLIDVLSVIHSPKRSERFKRLVIHADNFGTKYQYSRGLSVYFPWCEPLDDEPWPSEQRNGKSRPKPKRRYQKIIENYMSYDFNTEFGRDSWWSFLDLYFRKTKRLSRKEENPEEFFAQFRQSNFTDEDIEDLLTKAESSYNVDGSLSSRAPETGRTPETGKTPDTGVDCTCPTIKNYPTDNKYYPTDDKDYPRGDKDYPRGDKKQTRKIRKFSITPGALRAFRNERLDLTEEPFEDDDNDGE